MTEPASTEAIVAKPLRLDFGCGPNKCGPDWTGVDSIAFPGVDIICNLAEKLPPVLPPELTDGPVTAEKVWAIQLAANEAALHPKFKPWPFEDNSVDEAHASHFVEHLDAQERIHFCNELYRVLKVGSSAKIIIPHWASCRAYGDLTHAWPPVSEFWFYYLSSSWRAANAPHNVDYTCNFFATYGYSMREDLLVRNQEYQMFALSNFKETAQDIIATIKKEELTKPI